MFPTVTLVSGVPGELRSRLCIWPHVAWFALWNALDGLTTLASLAHGGRESNPAMALLMQTLGVWPAFVMVKSLAFAVLLLLALSVWRLPALAVYLRPALWVLSLGGALLLLNNLHTLYSLYLLWPLGAAHCG